MSQLPYLASPGNIGKMLEAIKRAPTPPKISQDFVKTKLGIPGSSGDQVATFLKRIGFSSSDSTPTSIYKDYRSSEGGKALAQAVKFGYSAIYEINEYAHDCSDSELKGMIIKVTGLASDARPVGLILSTLKGLISKSDFEDEGTSSEIGAVVPNYEAKETNENQSFAYREVPKSLGLNIGYTINLNLPETTNIEVFNAIFKSLKAHLLSDQDG